MKILVSEINKEAGDFMVVFSTEFGEGRAVWNGNRNPEEGKEYEVEFDITDLLRWDKDIILSKEKKFEIAIKEDSVFVTGVLENFSDGIADLRFGKSIIQLEMEGNKLPIGEYLEVMADSLELYDVNY